tara:strand:+ start:3325 stop:4422 length:1098 start_codon:yes stop_codon:yes gene_type:complete
MIKTAFSITRSQWKRYPVIETTDVTDLSVVEKYKNRYPYVWLKHKHYIIQPNFNWNFSPEQHNKNRIHSFPSCNPHSKRPVSWEVLRLVPTHSPNNLDVIRSNQIAVYKTNIPPIYMYAFKDKFVMDKYRKIKIPEITCHLINNKKTMAEVFESLSDITDKKIWLVNADVTISNITDLNYPMGNADIVRFPVKHKSTGLTYADDSVLLINVDYIKRFIKSKSNISFKTKVAEKTIGYVNDISDPFKAWANAYYTCLNTQYGNDTNIKKNKNKILGAYTVLEPSRVNDLIKAGVQHAEIDILNPKFDYDTFINWDQMLKRFTDYHTTSKNFIPIISDKRLKSLEKTYGKDSDEYQKLSSQLGKSSL